MRMAVADIGTNSSHLLVAEAHGGSYVVLDSLKVGTRLGECLEGGRLTGEGVRRLVDAARQFSLLAEARGAPLRVYATSALRESANQAAVLRGVKRETGVRILPISGEREGELTYRGAALSVTMAPDTLLLDLGGGSLELVRGRGEEPGRVVSLPIGVVRFMHAPHGKGGRDSGKGGKVSGKAVRELRAELRGLLAPHLQAFGVRAGTAVVGSSGTVKALAGLLEAQKGRLGSANGVRVGVDELGALTERMLGMSVAELPALPGFDPRRADTMHAGAIIWDEVLRTLGARELTVSEGALREGMLAEWLQSSARWEAGLGAGERSALELADRFRADTEHGRQVAELAVHLLGGLTRTGLTFRADAEALLRAAAMLHDVGLIVSKSSHHKHSAYLVRHAGLRGFSPEQTEWVALLCRYHRQGGPKPSHPEFMALGAADRAELTRLAAILRVADGFDRSHQGQAHLGALSARGKGMALEVLAASELDRRGAAEKADLWAASFGPLEFDLRPVTPPGARASAAAPRGG